MELPGYRGLKKGFRFLADKRYKSNTVINDSYLVKKNLGNGSYGTTYLCHDYQADRLCVVKQMTKSKPKKLIHAQYQQETKILKQLNHPGIPAFYERFSFHRKLFFSMEYIEGQNLEDILFVEERAFSERESLMILEKILNILDYIHSMGMVHGDLRIPNILLDRSNVYIIDFGLAKYFGHLPESVINKSTIFKNEFFDVGDLLLFLLYSTYTPTAEKELPWTEELMLKPATKHLLKRLLGLENRYFHIREVFADLKCAIEEADE